MAERKLNILVIFDMGVEPPADHNYDAYMRDDSSETESEVIRSLRRLGHEARPLGIYNDIHNLILLGYATSGVVLSTTRYAADLDYRLYIVEDCCADQQPDVHDFLTQRIFPRQADVVQSEDVIRALG